MKKSKRQSLGAITTKRVPHSLQIALRLHESRRWPTSLQTHKLSSIIAERKRKRRIKELEKKLAKAVTNAKRRGYYAFDDPRVKVLNRAYLKALATEVS